MVMNPARNFYRARVNQSLVKLILPLLAAFLTNSFLQLVMQISSLLSRLYSIQPNSLNFLIILLKQSLKLVCCQQEMKLSIICQIININLKKNKLSYFDLNNLKLTLNSYSSKCRTCCVKYVIKHIGSSPISSVLINTFRNMDYSFYDKYIAITTWIYSEEVPTYRMKYIFAF